MTATKSGPPMAKAGERRESPIINNPYEMPRMHLVLQNPPPKDNRYEVKDGRRPAGRVREHDAKKIENVEPYPTIAQIRDTVTDWRNSSYPDIDEKTSQLLAHWANPDNEPRLFFCQREAIETLIWLHIYEGRKPECDKIHEQLSVWNMKFNSGLPRLSTKMATGTGKTVVIAMLMLWMAVRRRDPISNFLVITPGTVVTERLQELYPSNRKNIFVEHGLLPPDMPMPALQIKVVHRHKLEPRSGIANEVGGKAPDRESSKILATGARMKAARHGGEVQSSDETFNEMMDRLCGHYPEGTPLCIINDEAHHCYATPREDEGNRKWFDAILRIQEESRFRLTAVHDFSATPIWIDDRPTDAPGEVFPWTVSDFPLIEAVESGLTKIPRVPTDTGVKGQEQARTVYGNVGPKRLLDTVPPDIGHYLDLLVNHHLQKTRPAYVRSGHNPILCVVADTVRNAEAFFRYIAGHWDKDDPAKRKAGNWPELSNIDEKGNIKVHPPTLLVHSRVDRGTGDDDDDIFAVDNVDLESFFGSRKNAERGKKKKLAKRIKQLFTTAGRTGEKGEHIRCIVSVSMLTEGWDCRTVTEIFGFRRFGSDLLIEQVTGRALRRTDYTLSDTKLFREQHANLIGVPFTWVPEGGQESSESEQIEPYDCQVVDGREGLEIRMPRIERYEAVPEHVIRRLDRKIITDHKLDISWAGAAVEVSFEGGQTEFLTTAENGMSKDRAIWTIAARATALLIERGTDKNEVRERLPVMRDLLVAAREWWLHPVSNTDGLERIMGNSQVAMKCAEALLQSCAKTYCKAWLRAHLFQSEEWATSAKPRVFTTRLRHRYPKASSDGTDVPTMKSQRNVAPCHSATEARVAEILDKIGAVDAWVRNEKLGFSIPYRGANGFILRYEPDFLARSKAHNYLILEYKGDWKGKIMDHEMSKRHYAENYWVPAVNAHPKIREVTGRWGFLWIDDDKNMQRQIEQALDSLDAEAKAEVGTTKETA